MILMRKPLDNGGQNESEVWR